METLGKRSYDQLKVIDIHFSFFLDFNSTSTIIQFPFGIMRNLFAYEIH